MTYLDKAEAFLDKYISDEDKQKAITDMFEILRECQKETTESLKITFFKKKAKKFISSF